MRRIVFILLMLVGAACAAQQTVARYLQLQKQYQHFAENEPAALPSVRKSIADAKKYRNYWHLAYAYEDAVYISPDKTQKLKFSDSTVWAARQTADPAWIAKSLLNRGIIWYFNFRNYEKAVPEFLEAVTYADRSGDLYLINKLKYQLGIAKNHLGYHEEAIQYFKECALYFRTNRKKATHPDLLYNFTRGHINTAHQMSLAYRRLGRWTEVDSLLQQTHFDRRSFTQEHGYFLKEFGIAAYQRGDYSLALDSLRPAAALIRGKKDEENLATVYYFAGAALLKQGDQVAGRSYLQKVDSLFTGNNMVSPEVRAALELLLKDTDLRREPERAAWLTAQLLKSDSIFARNFPYLSARLYREYDTAALRTEKQKLEQLHNLNRYAVTFSVVVSLTLLTVLGVLRLRRRREMRRQSAGQEQVAERQNVYGDEIVAPILEKLELFEKKEQYIDPDLSLTNLAKKLGTNGHRLSYVLNAHHGVNFNTYLTRLRVAYIIRLLDTDPKYLNYTVAALALTCGMRSRQHFSKVFYEMTGIRPSKYAHSRKQEVNPAH